LHNNPLSDTSFRFSAGYTLLGHRYLVKPLAATIWPAAFKPNKHCVAFLAALGLFHFAFAFGARKQVCYKFLIQHNYLTLLHLQTLI
jgi:hypothetical protein